jgi:hypothetical protein
MLLHIMIYVWLMEGKGEEVSLDAAFHIQGFKGMPFLRNLQVLASAYNLLSTSTLVLCLSSWRPVCSGR